MTNLIGDDVLVQILDRLEHEHPVEWKSYFDDVPSVPPGARLCALLAPDGVTVRVVGGGADAETIRRCVVGDVLGRLLRPFFLDKAQEMVSRGIVDDEAVVKVLQECQREIFLKLVEYKRQYRLEVLS